MTEPIRKNEAGFSLVELTIGMAVTLVVLGMAVAVLGGVFNIRTRENQRSDALADVQRAINIMSREIANAGFGLTGNGLVPSDCSDDDIRIRANLNAYGGDGNRSATSDDSEDIAYLETEGNLVRYNINTDESTVLAHRLDELRLYYFDERVSYSADADDCDITITTAGAAEVTNKANARYVIIVVCVNLPAVGSPGGSGYQPETRVKLVSDVVLRNAALPAY
jgi:type II secretory pathway pseudopilin PulG